MKPYNANYTDSCGLGTHFWYHYLNNDGTQSGNPYERTYPQSFSHPYGYRTMPITWEMALAENKQMVDFLAAAGFDALRISTGFMRPLAQVWRHYGSDGEEWARSTMRAGQDKMLEVMRYAISKGLKIILMLDAGRAFGDDLSWPYTRADEIYAEEHRYLLQDDVLPHVSADINEMDAIFFKGAPVGLDHMDESLDWFNAQPDKGIRIDAFKSTYGHIRKNLIDAGLTAERLTASFARVAGAKIFASLYRPEVVDFHHYGWPEDGIIKARWLDMLCVIGEYGASLGHCPADKVYDKWQAELYARMLELADGEPLIQSVGFWNTVTPHTHLRTYGAYKFHDMFRSHVGKDFINVQPGEFIQRLVKQKA